MTQKMGTVGGVDSLLCARDGIRIRLYGLVYDDEGRPKAPTDELAPRPVRIQAAWPPPRRTDGTQWNTAYGDKTYEIFKALVVPKPELGAYEVGNVANTYGLADLANLEQPETLILNQEEHLKFQWARTADFEPPSKDSDCIPATPYPQLDDPEVPVAFYGEFEFAWDDVEVPAGEYVAISLDRFQTTEKGVPFLVKVTDSWLFRLPPPKS